MALLTLPSMAASFDCSKAASPAEKLICASPALSTLDEDLAQLYKQRLAASPADGKQLRAEQRRWLQQHRDRCGTAECLSTAMAERARVLRAESTSLSQAAQNGPLAAPGEAAQQESPVATKAPVAPVAPVSQKSRMPTGIKGDTGLTHWRYGNADMGPHTDQVARLGNALHKAFRGPAHCENLAREMVPRISTVQGYRGSVEALELVDTLVQILEAGKCL